MATTPLPLEIVQPTETISVSQPQPIPVQTPVVPIQTPTPHVSVWNSIFHDLFVLGITAAAIFVKNPASQQKASTIVNTLQTLLNEGTGATQ